MIRDTVRREGLPFASRVLALGFLAAGTPLLAQPPATEGLREEVEAQFRVTATSGGIGLLPLDDDRGVALIELRGEAVYIDGRGPSSVQAVTDALGAAAAPLLRLRRLDRGRQRSVLGLPPPAGAAADVAAAADAAAPADDDTPAPADDDTADAAAAPADVAGAAAAGVAGAAAADSPAPTVAEGGGEVAAVTEDVEEDAVGDEAEPGVAAPAAAAASPAAAVAEEPRRRTVRGDVVRFGGYVHVPADERLDGDVVLIGGRLRVDGEVARDIVLIGGSAEFGPEAVVRRDVTVVGGQVTRHPGARFERRLNQVGFGGLDPGLSGLGGPFRWPRWPRQPVYGSTDLMETVIRFVFLGLLGSLVLLLGAGSARRVADRVTHEPVKAGVVGFLAQLLFFPLLIVGIVALVITLIGIPLLALVPLVLVAALVVLLLGFTGVVQLVSRLLARGHRSDFVLFWAGLALLMTPALFGDALDLFGGPFRLFAVILGVTGFVVEYLAWTAGSGAVILNWFDGAPAAAGGPPPPIPGSAPPGSLPPTAPPD